MGSEQGGQRTVVRATVPDIVDVLLDVEAYPQWQPGFSSSAVLERDDQGRPSLVGLVVDAKVRTVRLRVRFDYALPSGLRWDFVDGDVKDLSCRYTFTARPDGSTEVGCDISFDAGFYVPGPVKRVIRDQALRGSMRGLKDRVESRVAGAQA